MSKIERIILASRGYESCYSVVRVNGTQVRCLFSWGTEEAALNHFNDQAERGASVYLVHSGLIIRSR